MIRGNTCKIDYYVEIVSTPKMGGDTGVLGEAPKNSRSNFGKARPFRPGLKSWATFNHP